MSLKKTLFYLFSIAAICINAQDFTIKGKVADNHNIPLQYTTVSIQDPDTYDEITEGITDETGSFSVEAPQGSYLLYLETFGGSILEQPIEISKNTDLGTIVIKDETVVALETATITGNAQLYRMELDKKIYDVSKDDIAKGGSVSDALENVPSVELDDEGNVNLRGSSNVKILIDGKPSSLIGISDPATALKNLPADVVDRIEVITNPSARYEAEGSSGIINIVLKKGKMKGLNGSFNVYGGVPATAGAGVNLNYRTGKWNMFTNLSYRYSDWQQSGNSFTTRKNLEGIPRYEDMNQTGSRIGKNFNVLLGTEYFLDDRNTFSISGNFSSGKRDNETSYHYLDLDSNFNETASSNRDEDGTGDNSSIEGNLNYKHEFPQKGHELSIDLRGTYSESDNQSGLRELGSFVDSNERSFNKEFMNRTIFSADYVYPFSEKGKIEAGLRGELEGTLTDFKVDSLAGNDWLPKDNFANRTDYQKNIYAAYFQYGQGLGDNFSFFAGLRVEHSDITVESVLSNVTTKKNYTDFFPSLFLNYEFNNMDQLQLSYSRRVRRPRAWFLIPISSYSNNRSLFLGNPDLNPEYTDSFELSYVGKFGKLTLTPNVYFSHTSDNIQRYQTLDGNGIFVSRPVNSGYQNRYGSDITLTYRPWNWWNIMGSLNMYGYKTTGEQVDVFENAETGETITRTTNFDGKGFSWFGRVNNRFTLPEKFSVQLSGFFRGAQKTAQSERKPMFGTDLSLSKELFSDQATLTLSVRDLFNTRRFKMTSFGDDFHVDREFRWSKRSVNLTFTYRFNQSKREQMRRQRAEQNGGEDFEMMPEGGM